MGYCPWGHTEWDMTKQLSMHAGGGKEAGRVVHSPFGREGVLGWYIPLWGREK